MAEYYNSNGYPPPPADGYNNNYPPPPRPHEAHQQYGAPGYISPTAAQIPHGYLPAREDQYWSSPRSSALQVGQYTGNELDYGRERRNSRHYAGSDPGYLPPPPAYDDRPSSRGSRRDRSLSKGEKHDHKLAKDVGATLLGGALGTWAGRELGHKNDLVTVAGALAGAYAGHKLESKHEKNKKKKNEQRGSEGLGYGGYHDDGSRRSLRSKSGSRRRSPSSSSNSSSSSSDASRRRHRRHRH